MKHPTLWILVATSLAALPLVLRLHKPQRLLLTNENLRYAIDDLILEDPA